MPLYIDTRSKSRLLWTNYKSPNSKPKHFFVFSATHAFIHFYIRQWPTIVMTLSPWYLQLLFTMTFKDLYTTVPLSTCTVYQFSERAGVVIPWCTTILKLVHKAQCIPVWNYQVEVLSTKISLVKNRHVFIHDLYDKIQCDTTW